MRSIDGSSVKPIRMPKLSMAAEEVDVWFEMGKIRFNDPLNPEEICSVTVGEFEERIRGLSDYVDELESRYNSKAEERVVYCGKKEFKRFFNAAMEMIEQCRRQIHVGLPLSTINEAESEIRPVSSRSGFHSSKSGLLVPD